MTLLIDVGTVLQRTVCDLYSNLVTRPTGAAVRSAIEQQVLETGAPMVTTIDFSQVNLLDFSCADEIVAKLLKRYATDASFRGYLLFRGIREEHLVPIEAVLEHHRLALVSWFEGDPELLGEVETDDRRHWEAVRERGPADALDVAMHLGTSQDVSSPVLRGLHERRLLMRDGVRYRIPTAVWGEHV